jgi:hypothetical protein
MARRPDRLTSERTTAAVDVNPNGLWQNVIEISCSLISYVAARIAATKFAFRTTPWARNA